MVLALDVFAIHGVTGEFTTGYGVFGSRHSELVVFLMCASEERV